MTVLVDIADRLYDYTDEEVAAAAVARFQNEFELSDEETVEVWQRDADPLRHELEKCILRAIDENGTSKRARESVPGGITLTVE